MGTCDLPCPSPRAGLMFLTRLPVPAGTDHHPTYLMRSSMVRRASLREG